MRNKRNKLGYQAPKRYRVNTFKHIDIDYPLIYCKSHNFVYDREEESRKLYNGEPCHFTDDRFIDNDYFINNGKKSFSLKACIRKMNKIRNMPVGATAYFSTGFYYPGKKISTGFIFKCRKTIHYDPKYEINLPEFRNNFTTCKKSQQLTEALRESGFLVKVYNENPHLLYGSEDGEIAIAYGKGLIIGFSSGADTFRGYEIGCESILWDRHGEFDKWSRCNEISKELSVSEIMKEITNM